MRVRIERKDTSQVVFRISGGELCVAAPVDMPLREIENLIDENSDWIRKKIRSSGEKYPANLAPDILQEKHLLIEYFSYKKCLLCGKVMKIAPTASKSAELLDDTIYLPEKYCESKELRKKCLNSYIKKIAGKFLSEEIAQFGSSVSICPSYIQLKALSGAEWCKCRDVAEGKVVVDYRSIQLPCALRKYVVAHAFSHFFVPGHTDEYWRVLSNYVPEYAQLKSDLQYYDFLKEL